METNHPDEKLNAPCDFVASTITRGVDKDLMTPSHFTSSSQSTSMAVPGAMRGQGTPPITWVSNAPQAPVNPWLAIAQAKQEIIELRHENQRVMMLQRNGSKGLNAADDSADSRARSVERSDQPPRWELEWRLDVERQRAEAERWRGQVEALKEAAGRHREEMRDKESYLNRQNLEMEAVREELCKTKAELSLMSAELGLKREEIERVSSRLERLERESGGEIERLRREVERGRQEAQRLTMEAEAASLQAGTEAREQALKLRQQLEEAQSRQATELQQVTSSYGADLASARQTSSDLQERLCLMSQELTGLKAGLLEVSAERDGLKAGLLEVSAERDGLKEQLSQTGSALESQSATLQNLRNYIGQLSPARGEEEKLTETIQRLNGEKEALQVTTELLTVRLNSVNDILALQEEEMAEKAVSEPFLKAAPKGIRVLRRWREKVFLLLVQLRSKDLEMRGEKDKLHSAISSLEEQVKTEKNQASVFQHCLQDRAAELDLERVSREAVEQNLSRTLKENAELKSRCQEAVAGLRAVTDSVQRFGVALDTNVAEMAAVQTRLNGFSQRLTFAKRRVDTIQGLILRREALWRVQQQAAKPAHPVSESGASLGDLRAELSRACEERDQLAQELKRSPELIENALADLREQFEAELRQLRAAAEQGRLEAREAAAGREEAQGRLEEARAQLEESSLGLEQLSGQLLSQQEHSGRALSEAEERCAQRLREMEAQLNVARREHTKAVVALRQFQRHAEREREQEREAQRLQTQHANGEIQELQKRLQEKDKDRNLLLATVRERGLLSEYKKARSAALRSSTALREPERASGKTSLARLEAKGKPPAKDSALLSVLGDLQALSTALVHGEEDSGEEDGRGDGGDGRDT